VIPDLTANEGACSSFGVHCPISKQLEADQRIITLRPPERPNARLHIGEYRRTPLTVHERINLAQNVVCADPRSARTAQKQVHRTTSEAPKSIG